MGTGVRQQKLVLILAKELSDKLASAMFVVDREGKLVYFNERAAQILGVTFAELGPAPLDVWTKDFVPVDLDGNPLPTGDLPLVVALERREPGHRRFRIRGRDGELREIAVTAFPLLARADEIVGAAAIFWEHPQPETKGSEA